MGGDGGEEDVFGPGYFSYARRSFSFANNTKHIVELFLTWIFLLEKWVLDFFN